MQPLISIIIPIYNTEKYLPKSVDSILIQKFDNCELLLITLAKTTNPPK
ncbi:MAG: glycosyltransferase [Firmicutes bacterium]|nr:glycosyltransferase [Bacillota bacterium]